MIISICGTHGTGKTTTLNKIALDGYKCIEEATRKLLPILGWKNPYDFINNYGIVFYESIIMNQWAFLTQLENSSPKENIYLDTSPIDNLAYYYLLRTEEEKKYESTFCKLCEYYCSYIDKYILFKSGEFGFISDEMRTINKQAEHEYIIINLMKKFDLDYYVIQQKEIDNRVKEIYAYTGGIQNENV